MAHPFPFFLASSAQEVVPGLVPGQRQPWLLDRAVVEEAVAVAVALAA